MTGLLDPDSADLSLLQDRQVAVLGFGAVAAAHALNLRDSGVDVRIGLDPDSRGAARADMEGLLVVEPERGVEQADLVVVPAGEAPDPQALGTLLHRLEPEDLVLVTDGESVRFEGLTVPAGVDVVMLRTIGGGERMRSEYLDGRGAPCLVAVHTNATAMAWAVLTAYAAATGSLRSGAIVTTTAHEAEATRFADAGVHDSVQRLVEAGFEVLVAAGVEPEVAYLACLHELKERVDEVCAGGFVTQHGPGGEPRTSGVIGDALRGRLAQVWEQVRAQGGEGPDGTPAVSGGSGGTVPGSRRDAGRAAHPLEQVGRRVRAMMSWIR